MRKMTITETRKTNGGVTESLSCRICKKFKVTYSYSRWNPIQYCLNRGQAAIELRTHQYACAEING